MLEIHHHHHHHHHHHLFGKNILLKYRSCLH